MGFFKSQLLEVIEWRDSTRDTLAYHFPVGGNEIKNGAKLIVRESQLAIFVKDGQLADIFSPGTYTLNGGNTPILSKLGAWKYGFNSPFKSEVYFISTLQYTDIKWGTLNPVAKRDAEFGIVRIRAFGNFTYKVTNPEVFLREVLGTKERVVSADVDKQLKTVVMSTFVDTMAETNIAVVDLAAKYDEIGYLTKEKVAARAALLGVEVIAITVENISLPPEVEAYVDKKTSMNVMGNMQQMQEFEKANLIGNMAKNGGNGGGGGNDMTNLAAGLATFGIVRDALNPNQQGGGAVTRVICPSCGANVIQGTKFCPECGNPMQLQKVSCINCKAQIPAGLKFCPECGANQQAGSTKERRCTKCGAPLQPGDKFCMNCGTKN